MTFMLKIRLQRVGRKHEPVFRLVVTDSKNGPKSGRFLEVVGSHDARRDFEVKNINVERVKHWMAQGAKVSDTVHNFFVQYKIIEGKKLNVLPRKSPIKKGEAAAEPVKAAAPAAATPKAEDGEAPKA